MLLSSKEPSAHCHPCAKYQNTLHVIASQKRRQITINGVDLTSHINYRYLAESEKIEKMKKQHSEVRKTKLQRDWLIEKLERLTQSQGASVDIGLHNDLCRIINDEQGAISKLPEDSFQRLFWEQQSLAVLKKNQSSKGTTFDGAAVNRQLV